MDILYRRILFIFVMGGVCLLPHVLFAQDNPLLDTPVPIYPERTGITPSVTVITTPDGFDNFDLGSTNAEPHMSTTPLNPLWFFNAFNTNSTFRTLDGHTWTASSPSFPNAAGDPVTAYDSLGNLYYETMKSPITGCWVIRSINGGQTWTSAVTSVAGVDKNWIAADQTMGPYANYVYTTMTAGSGVGNFARSTDFGLTWTTTFSPTTQLLPGMMVAVGPNVLGGNNISGGCVYVVTHSGTNGAGTYTFYRSTDGGLTFTQMSQQQFSNYIGTEVAGRSTVQFMRCRPYPFIAADNSFGPFRGRLYLVYASNNPAGNGNKSDIFLRYSTDQGASWSSARVVNDDPNSQNNFQFHPAIWCDKETGRLYIKFYDTRRVPTSDSMDVYATYTDDGGETFAPNQRLTNRHFRINFTNVTTATYRGDYDAITSNRYVSGAVWTDFRNSNYLGMFSYFPDFAMLASNARDTLRNIDSSIAMIRIPAVKLYTYIVRFSASVTPSAPFVFVWPQGDTLSSVPDSLPLIVRTNNVPNGNYTISVRGEGPNGTPVHRRTFSIRVQYIPNTVAVLQPNDGEQWVEGQNKTIKWRTTGDVDTIRIEYSSNNGSTWMLVNANVSAGTDSINWTVPSPPTTQGLIRVAWIDSTMTIWDQSDNVFSVLPPTPLISTAPDSLRAILQAGNNTGFDTLLITNSGTLLLNWSSTGPTWANAFPNNGSVPADSTRKAPVRFSANGLIGGTYLDYLTITSNDTFNSPTLVPLRLTVVGVPQIVVTPSDTLRFGSVPVGRTDTLNVWISNTGTDTLRGNTVTVPPIGNFRTLTPSFKAAPNDSTFIRVSFMPFDSNVTYSATLRITSNDPDPNDDTLFVALTGRGTGVTSVEIAAHGVIPTDYRLDQNYPNPFNPSTTIRFALPTPDHVTLKIYNLLGKEIASLADGYLAAGEYKVDWQAADLPSGVYFYRLQSGTFNTTRKLLLLK
jgi:hypothetical protein